MTLTEVLTGPYRTGELSLAAAFEARIHLFPNLFIADVSPVIAQIAARIRGHYGFRLPDAVHLASALAFSAETFITNDRRIQQFRELPVTLLSDFIH